MTKRKDPSRDRDFIVFGAPAIGEGEIAEVVNSLETGWIGTGPKVEGFESAFADYKKVARNSILATNSCTSALHLSLIASGVGSGDEVITSAMTFCATANAIIHSGATPVIADVDPDTRNVDPSAIADRINCRTKAILPVHFAGALCDMDSIVALTDKHGLRLIEDCAHAIETESEQGKAGTFGDFGCFSFYATKNITTGEGGMIIAKNAEDIRPMKSMALHGMTEDAWHRYCDQGYRHYLVTQAGFKYNMIDIQAAIGLHQLKRIDQNWQRRSEIWDYYQQVLGDLPLRLPARTPTNQRHGYHLFTLVNEHPQKTREQILEQLKARKIGCGVHYLCLAEHPYYQKTFGWKPEQVPNASHIGQNTFSIPFSAKLSDNDVEYIASSLRDLLSD